VPPAALCLSSPTVAASQDACSSLLGGGKNGFAYASTQSSVTIS